MRQAHRPGGITPRRGFLLPCCVGAVVWVYAVRRSVGRCTAFFCCGRVGVPRRRFGRSVGCLCGCGRCAAVLPSYLKRIFNRFFQGIRNRTPPGRGLAVRLQALHQLITEPTPPAAHRRHSIHRQNQPQQAPTDSTNEDTTARNGTEQPTQRKYRQFYYTFSSEFFGFSRVGTISPGLTLCGTVAPCH